MTLDERERFIVEQIQRLQQEYQMAARPWTQRLARLRALRPTRYLVIDDEFSQGHKIIEEQP